MVFGYVRKSPSATAPEEQVLALQRRVPSRNQGFYTQTVPVPSQRADLRNIRVFYLNRQASEYGLYLTAQKIRNQDQGALLYRAKHLHYRLLSSSGSAE